MIFLLTLASGPAHSAAFIGALSAEGVAYPLLALAATAAAICLWGVLSLRSGILCRARWRGAGTARQVALTYDDGPDPKSTPPLLDLLAERGVRATFFCVGEKVRAHSEVVRRCHAEGHLVANHSDRHSPYTNFLFARRLQSEIEACQAAIEEVIGERPRYYRPPYGLANHALARVARWSSLEVIGWQVRGLDTPKRASDAVALRILRRVRPGGIVLLHDGDRGPERVVASTRAVLDGLEELGLEPVRLDSLLDPDPAGGGSGAGDSV